MLCNIEPGCSVEGGEAGVDYFVSQDDVHNYYDSAEYCPTLTVDSTESLLSLHGDAAGHSATSGARVDSNTLQMTGQQIKLKSLKV